MRPPGFVADVPLYTTPDQSKFIGTRHNVFKEKENLISPEIAMGAMSDFPLRARIFDQSGLSKKRCLTEGAVGYRGGCTYTCSGGQWVATSCVV
jgi:hypothetical protein